MSSDSDDSSVKLIDEAVVDNDDGKAADKPNKKPAKKTVEERYKKLDPLEHILKRPDTYGTSKQRRS